MEDKTRRFCPPMSATHWIATGAGFIAIGIQQPPFLALGAAILAIGASRAYRARCP